MKTITKEWEIESPVGESVDSYINNIKRNCDNMKRGFPGFKTYKFKIDSYVTNDYGSYVNTTNLTMKCTREETEEEKRKKLDTAKKRRKTLKLNKTIAEAKEKEHMYTLMKKYKVNEMF